MLSSKIICPVTIDVRFKITDRCQWQCSFCHNEGNLAASDAQWSSELEGTLHQLRNVLPISEVHLTGGEPTLSPYFIEIARHLSDMNFRVKMTTNGQFKENELGGMKIVGISGMNVSVHSIDPYRFLRFQDGRGTTWRQKGKRLSQGEQEIPDSSFRIISPLLNEQVSWAVQAIERQLGNLRAAKLQGMNVKINTVISTEDDLMNAEEIIEWARRHEIGVRLLNDLSNPLESEHTVLKLLTALNAEYVFTTISPVSSSYTNLYRMKDDYELVFKRIRRMFLAETMCRRCPRSHGGTCEEGFYGIRLQLHGQVPYVLLCIREINQQTLMPARDFLVSSQLREIQKLLTTS